MPQEIEDFLIAAAILIVLAVFVPCLESTVAALRRKPQLAETKARDTSANFIL